MRFNQSAECPQNGAMFFARSRMRKGYQPSKNNGLNMEVRSPKAEVSGSNPDGCAI